MTHLKIKLGVAGVILAAAVTYLVIAGMQKGWVYTVGVEQYLALPQHDQRIRICGIVAPNDLQINPAQLAANFYIKGTDKELRVNYRGVVPDLFKEGAEIIVEGKQDTAGVFQADVLLTKCASKYEGKPADHPPVKGETGTKP
jgi:cytochrome c-type biogenesis protein CcmE